jgi:hypothetical protein
MRDADKKDLVSAVQQWTAKLRKIDGRTRFHMSQKHECMDAINALNKEIDTGIPHCICHLMKHEDCPTINS